MRPKSSKPKQRAKSAEGGRAEVQRPPDKRPQAEHISSRRPFARTSNLWIYLLLFVVTLAVYAPAIGFDFVNFDDPEYVSKNPQVVRGITPEGIAWAFTSGDSANWFPLTRLSQLLDWQLFGPQSGMHHFTNVLFHGCAALLLFGFLNQATRARSPSAFVAFLFALHPLHVESVAWVAERKDVLCAFFWCLTLWAYVRYTEHSNKTRYAVVLGSFCLGLMSKPMIVTLPFQLLLFDIWPLGRLRIFGIRAARKEVGFAAATARNVILEKVPLAVLSIAAAAVTYLVQQRSGAVEALTTFPFELRVANAVVSYTIYIAKFLCPAGLAVFYPYPQHLPAAEFVFAGIVLAGISIVVALCFRDRPYLAVGWLWYLGTLLPVIGFVQIGAQARADRYAYMPLTGLSIMVAWSAAEMVRRWPNTKKACTATVAAACLACVALTSLQLRHWRSSESLFRHALAVTSGNYLAYHNLGVALAATPGNLPEAIQQFESSLRINPDSSRTHTDLANALSSLPDRLPEAVSHYEAALRIDPNSAVTQNDLANTLSKIPGRLPEAISHYQIALRLNPDYAEAHNNLGSALAPIPGRLSEAIAEYQAALRIRPDYAQARHNMETALSNAAQEYYKEGLALTKAGQLPEAILQYEAALRIRPDYAEAHNNLGIALAQTPGRLSEAIAHFEAALRIKPNYQDAQYNLQLALQSRDGFKRTLTRDHGG